MSDDLLIILTPRQLTLLLAAVKVAVRIQLIPRIHETELARLHDTLTTEYWQRCERDAETLLQEAKAARNNEQ